MSFSSIIKDELCRVKPGSDCCVRAELASAYYINNAAGAPSDCLVTENAAFARRTYTFLKILHKAHPVIVARKKKNLKKNAIYTIRMEAASSLADIICGAQAMQSGAGAGAGAEASACAGAGAGAGAEANACAGAYAGVEDIERLKKLIRKKCCKKAALRGAFLAGGSITDPEKLYHLEIYCKKYDLAQFFSGLMADFDLNPKIMERTDYSVVYIKDSEQIVDFLNITGAHRALMSLENTRIIKDVRNIVNRAINCETANLEKTINASLRQISNIIFIKSTIGFDALPDNLREIAEAREANREISLKELGLILDPPLGKSGVNHRLRKLDALADAIRDNHFKV